MRAWIIETSTERGLITFLEGEMIRFVKELPLGYNQSKSLMTELQQAYQSLNLLPSQFDCIGVGVGPGSYTGIRIGVAVAKTLAYAWQLPLIGFCSLEAFIPRNEEGAFAALIDAKIGGAYFLKGVATEGSIQYVSTPQVCPLDQLGFHLQDTKTLITPYTKTLKEKIDVWYPKACWQWIEASPSAKHMGLLIRAKYQQGEWSRQGHLKLLYLRETEAEREKKLMRQSTPLGE